MGRFILEGNHAALAPVAEQMGLFPCAQPTEYSRSLRQTPEARWEKTFPPRKKGKDRWKGGTLRSAPPERPFDNGDKNDREKGVEYARWLARRDGIKLAEWSKGVVFFRDVKMAGYKNPVRQASHVTFGSVLIVIPHCGYDPTLPAVETLLSE